MFTSDQEEYLIRRLRRNDVILFLGAGFSADAMNSLDENLPLGKGLASKLWDFIGFPGDYGDDGTPLQDMYQALINSGKSFDQISLFLKENLMVKSFPDYYKYLAIPFWYKIYTINIDNLTSKIYERYGQQHLDVLTYPKEDFKERDQLLNKLQIVYLNGKLPCRPDEIIFSRPQYANASLQLQPLYFHFIQDYSNLPTIFIGTALEEQLLEQYISSRQSRLKDIPENRPKSFLIVPTISLVRKKILKDSYNIEVVEGSAKDFLEWIASISQLLPDKEEIIKSLLPSYAKLMSLVNIKEYNHKSIGEFAQAFSFVDVHKKYPPKHKNYLLGTTPTWSDMHYSMDASRKITSIISDFISSLFSKNEICCIAIKGTAGSGKSTVLKRICYDFSIDGRSVYYSYSETLPDLTTTVETLQMLNERVIIAFDNAELILTHLVKMMEALNKIKFPPIILLASRTNAFDRVSGKIDPILNFKEYEILNTLEREEIVAIIKKLTDNSLLGYLKGLSDVLKIKEFENRAKKQILVAMREATQGKEFDEIIRSEFDEIITEEAKILCLCVALTTDAGFTISKQDFTSFSAKSPSESLNILDKNLKGIVLKIGLKEDKIILRHRTIAEFLIEKCTNAETLKQVYIRVLSSLASEINASNWGSRKFAMYKEIINHYIIYKRFAKNIQKAREVYEYLIDYFKDDFQFWLQYGSLELEGAGGNLELADNYLQQAYSLKHDNILVKNALANLHYKKALNTHSQIEANSMKDFADNILLEMLKDKFKNDPYTYHIFGNGNYNYIIKWFHGREILRKAFLDLLKIIDEGCEKYPNNKRLKELKEVLFKAILMTSVNKDDIQFPIIYSEFDIN